MKINLQCPGLNFDATMSTVPSTLIESFYFFLPRQFQNTAQEKLPNAW